MNRKLIIHIMIILTLLVAVSCVFTPYALKKYRKYCAVKAYHEFIEGKRDCMGQDILSLATPTGEPKRRYATKYFITDSTGDEVPELHVWGRICIVFTFDHDEMAILDSFASSSAGMYYLLNNGVMIYNEYVKNVFGNYYYYFILDGDGNRIKKLSFGWEDIMIIRDLILMIYMFLMIQYVRWKIGLKRQKDIFILMKMAGSQCVMKRSGLCIVKRNEIIA